MQAKTIGTVVATALLAAVATQAVAHHSGAMFDDKKEVTLSGTVKEFQYTNPHSWLLVDVKDKSGKVVTWGFEAEGPSSLTRAGIRKSDFAPGTPITITGHPMRDGRPAAAWMKATRTTDNKEFNPLTGFAVKKAAE
jgi:formylmethanofuran dehydrogenase subunit B